MEMGKTDLVIVNGNLNAQRYCDQIISPVVLPFTQRHPGFLFQQDNAHPHTTRITTDLFQRNNVQMLDWPARSPDLSPTEHVGDMLGRRVREYHQDINNVYDLEHALNQDWKNVTVLDINQLTNSMRRRCIIVISFMFAV